MSASFPDSFRVHSFSKVFHICTPLQIPEIEMITGWCPQTSSALHEQKTGYVNHHGKDEFLERTEKNISFSPFLDSLSRKLSSFKCLHCVISDIVQCGMDPGGVAEWCWEWLHPLNIWEASVSAVCRSPSCQPVCAGEAQFLMQSRANSEKNQLHSFLLSPLHFAFSLNKTALINPMPGNGEVLFFRHLLHLQHAWQ